MPALSAAFHRNGIMLLALAYHYDYAPVVHPFAETAAGWVIVATFLALMVLH